MSTVRPIYKDYKDIPESVVDYILFVTREDKIEDVPLREIVDFISGYEEYERTHERWAQATEDYEG